MIEIKNTRSSDGETHELDPQLWHACAGGMVQMPPINSKVIYFPQGHIEHAQVDIDYKKLHPLPPLVPCRISSISYLADRENDEVYAKISLVPIKSTDTLNDDNDGGSGDGGFVAGGCGNESNEFGGGGCDKTASFAKTLTQSDANNGGGFSVPRYCAETIFPRLDYSAEPPVQTILAKDVHGVTWKFRHIYRGTPRRHLLTTGWSNFVNQKKLVAGDSIVFLRAENGDLCVGIRRAKNGLGCGPESPSSYSSSGWTGNGNGGFSAFLRDDIRGLNRMTSSNSSSMVGGFVGTIGKAVPESVTEAVNLAARGQPFEVIYYPRASTPEFCVKASAMRAAMQIQWCSGMRFKMAFETEDSSRISWFMGTISAVQVADPIRWPGSPWRLIQVTWDEPDLLRNVKRVNPWLVEIVSSVPNIHHMSPFSSPRKKLRLVNPHAPYDFPMINQMRMMPLPPTVQTPGFPPTNINISSLVGIEGARHAQFTKCCLPDFRGLNNNNKTQQQHHLGLFPSLLSYHQTSAAATHLTHSPPINFVGKPPSGNHTVMDNGIREDDISCLLTMGNNNKKLEHQIPKGSDDSSALVAAAAAAKFMLFGKPILTEEQISGSSSSSGDCSSGSSSSGSSSNNGVAAANFFPGSNNSSSTADKKRKIDVIGLFDTTDHCKVFMESEDVGRTLDLSVIGSYEEMFSKLENMFGMERPEMLSNVMYRNCSGATKHVTGDLDKPFSEFLRTARRLTILTDGRGDNMAR